MCVCVCAACCVRACMFVCSVYQSAWDSAFITLMFYGGLFDVTAVSPGQALFDVAVYCKLQWCLLEARLRCGSSVSFLNDF